MESRPKAPSRGAASSSTVGFLDLAATDPASLVLEDGDRVCVLGGGPAGSFFTHFFQQMARRVGLQVEIDIYERKDFGANGPPGCNHCGGIVSESLVQLLAAEGINLPPNVVRRGIESYVLHTDAGMVRIETPSRERRIAAMFRGGGPRGGASADWASFDAFLLDLAREAGARVIQEYVKTLDHQDGRPVVVTRDGERRAYDLLVGATGVNALSGNLYEGLGIDYGPPGLTRTYICEYHLGEETVRERFGEAMHVFLLNIPRLKFAALVPKGDHVTMCMLGRDIDRDLVGELLAAAGAF